MGENNLDAIVTYLLQNDIETKDFYFEDASKKVGRHDFHELIVAQMMNGTFSDGKFAYILGGAPANGKSSFLNSEFCKYRKTALRIDPDAIKSMLPEYEYMVSKREPRAAAIVHEESSMISKEIIKRAMQKDYDIILDGVADDTLLKRKQVYDEFVKHRYYVRMDYVSLATSLSLQIAKIRAEETGREVPEWFIRDMNRSISTLLPMIIENDIKVCDFFYLWDTNNFMKPVLVLKKIHGNLVILEKELYMAFKAKRNE